MAEQAQSRTFSLSGAMTSASVIFIASDTMMGYRTPNIDRLAKEG
jgi:hypothetical protein